MKHYCLFYADRRSDGTWGNGGTDRELGEIVKRDHDRGLEIWWFEDVHEYGGVMRHLRVSFRFAHEVEFLTEEEADSWKLLNEMTK